MNMEHDLTERKRKKKYKKRSSKTKKIKRDRSPPGGGDDNVSSEGELQWVESTGPATSTSGVQSSEDHVLKRDSWMTVPLSPSSGSLTELSRRKTVKEDKNDIKVFEFSGHFTFL